MKDHSRAKEEVRHATVEDHSTPGSAKSVSGARTFLNHRSNEEKVEEEAEEEEEKHGREEGRRRIQG